MFQAGSRDAGENTSRCFRGQVGTRSQTPTGVIARRYALEITEAVWVGREPKPSKGEMVVPRCGTLRRLG